MNSRTALLVSTAMLTLLLNGCGGGGGSEGQGGEQSGGGGGGGGGVNKDTVVLLNHQGLVFDQLRQVYYAAVSSTDEVRGNRIATIDRSGAITSTTSPIGSSPTAIAISRDGSKLYVGLNGTGEIAQYSLPSFTRLSVLALPADAFSGQTRAEQISVSPIEPNTFVASLAYERGSPRHAGVVLVKDMSILPTRTPFHFLSNRVVFDPLGDSIYAFNNESTEFGLRRLQPTSDGITQQLVVPVTGADFDWDIEAFGNIVMVGGQAYSTTTLASRGFVSGASFHCVGVGTNSKVACFSNEFGRILVAETTNFTRLGEVSFSETPQTAAYRLVAGPSGQIAASAQDSGRIYLIDSDLLR